MAYSEVWKNSRKKHNSSITTFVLWAKILT